MNNSVDIISRAKTFAEEALKPIARQLDKDNRFPEELLPDMVREGFFGIHYPTNYGGMGLDSVTAYTVMEKLAKESAGVALTFHVHWMACDALLKFGTEEQKKKYLVPMLEGKSLAAWSISEPEAGSDAAGIAATAKAVEKGWILNGNKFFCTNGGLADLYFIACKTQPELGAKGITMFIVEKGANGFKVGPKADKMGCRSSVTTSLLLNDCGVPAENILGNVNGGFKIALYGLVGGRLGMASMGLGIARAAMNSALKYANQRQAFGKPLANLYAIQEMASDMYVKTQALEGLVSKASAKMDSGEDCSLETSVAKLAAAETVNAVCHAALQVFGGHGYMKYQDVERYYRDARVLDIGVGASEVLKSVVGMTVLKSNGSK